MLLLKLNQILLFTLAFVTFSTTHASTDLKSGCYFDEKDKEVQLLPNTTDERFPIASVSKVFTSVMAATNFNLRAVINSKPVRAPFSTEFFIRNITTARGKPSFHVHIKGSGDPYFNRFKMHRAISLLNERGVSEIDYLTFDENVKFVSHTDSKSGFYIGKQIVTPLTLKAEMDFPSDVLVKHQFQEFWKILADYNKSFKSAKSVGIKMVSSPKFTVRKVDLLDSTDFRPWDDQRNFHVESQTMTTMLKMMNWNSNNYTANRIYTISGGDSQFKDIFYTGFKVPTTMLTFVNGSGQNHDLAGSGVRVYNEASCSVVLRAVRTLNKRVSDQGKKITDVLAVVGIDIGSTVSGAVYSNEFTKGKVVAKTGTVGTNIALAGAINTKNGLRYFMFNVGAKQQGNIVSEHQARKIISEKLATLVKETKDVVAFPYKPNLALMDQYGFENYDEDLVEGPSELAPPPVISASLSAKPPSTVVLSAKK